MADDIRRYINEAIDRYEDDNEKADLDAICHEVREKFGVKCDYTYTGGFDSPGYDIDCYAIAFIGLDGELYLMDYSYERY